MERSGMLFDGVPLDPLTSSHEEPLVLGPCFGTLCSRITLGGGWWKETRRLRWGVIVTATGFQVLASFIKGAP